MRRSLLIFYFVLIGTMAGNLLANVASAAMTDEAAERDVEVAGVAWIREIGEYGFQGFYPAENGKLYYFNIPALTGVSWKVTGSRLTLESRTRIDPEPRDVAYMAKRVRNTLMLTPEDGGEALTYKANDWVAVLGNNRWVPEYVRNTQDLEKPSPDEIHLLINTKEHQITGFAGVNTFRTGYTTDGETQLAIGPIMATRMAGPGLDWEQALLKALHETTTMLVVRDMFFLYQDTELVASFKATHR